MKVSLNTVKRYIDFELPPVDELVARINERLGGVEEVIDLAAKYKDAKIVKVVECEKHPNADRLNVCKVDVGAGDLVQVVCGAPNVQANMWAVWLPPQSVVPSTFGTDDPFTLGARELRGVMSHGMLAAADELGIGNDHEGILVVDPDEWKPGQTDILPGASFAEVYGLDDYVIEIENKMFTHRPDLFGQLGVAREIAGILGQKFTSPEWYTDLPLFEPAEGLELEVFNHAGEKVPRFMAVAMKNVSVKPSPLWLQCALVAMGGKPINNIVDATNYVMLLTAQPTHAYDYDKLRGHTLGVRLADKGETAQLLNGKTYVLNEHDIVIVDSEGVVGLGGVMGGGNSEVSSDTKNIVLEVATFDMYAVRKTSMRHGVFTDALTRFNKGQSPLQNDRVLNLLIKCITDVSAAVQASEVVDYSEAVESTKVAITPEFINERLGLDLHQKEIRDLLTNVELGIQDEMTILPAFWRTDIELPEDVVEEVGRLYGFDKLPRVLPIRSAKPVPKNPRLELKWSIRQRLAEAGANEVLTYSFVNEKVLLNAGQDPSVAYRLSNALSPDLQYYRLGLTPSLLAKVHMNMKAGYDSFALFELGKAHLKGDMDTEEPGAPAEDERVAGVIAYSDKHKPSGAAFYQARKLFEQINTRADCVFQPLASIDLTHDAIGKQFVAAYDPKRSIGIVQQGRLVGVIGEYTSEVRSAFKLPGYVAGFEIRLDGLTLKDSAYRPLSRYPGVSQDISLKVEDDVHYAALENTVQAILGELDDTYRAEFSPISIYRPDSADTKTITFRISVTSYERTLTDDEVKRIVGRIAESAADSYNAQLV